MFAFAGTDAQSIDTDAVDLIKFPGWSNLTWWEANMEAGDCLFIPSGWYVAIRVISFAWTALKTVAACNRYHHVDSPRPPGGEPQLNLGTFCLAPISR